MKRALSVTGWLTVIYLMIVGSMQPGDLLFGVILAVFGYFAAVRLLPREVLIEQPPWWQRLVFLPVFGAAVVVEVLRGSWRVAWLTLGLRRARQPRIVEVPIAGRSDWGIAVTGLVHTLTPSSYLVDVDKARGVMLFQILDAPDPQAICDQLQRFYQRYQRRIFP